MIKTALLISTEFPPYAGGIGSHAFALALELKRRDWEVVVASEQQYASDEEIAAFNKSQAFRVVKLPVTPSMILLLKKIWFLYRLALSSKSQFIIGTGKHGSWFAYIVARLLFKKCVLIGHGTEFSVTMSNRSKRINKFVYSHADLLVCVSNYTKLIAERESISNPHKAVIHNGADSDVYYKITEGEIAAFKTARQITEQKVIVTIGNVTDRKGQEWVIRAMPEILKALPNIHYYIIGKPTLQEKLEGVANELGVANHVHFLGRRPTAELREWLNACDIFAMTSAHVEGDFEGFGISVIEAALCGKCAIVTNESGVAESIVDGQSGLAVPEKDGLAVAKAAITILGNDELRNKMDEFAYTRANEGFTWKVQIEKYIALFQSIS